MRSHQGGRHKPAGSHETQFVPLISAIASIIATTLTVVAVTASPASAALQAATGEEIVMNGGDLVTPPRPISLRAPKTLGTGWTTLDIDALAAIPSTGMGAAVLEAATSRAKGSGSVLVRPYGSTEPGVALTAYTKTGGRTLGLVASGSGGRIQIRATGNAPKLGVRVVAWAPEQSHLTVPTEPGPEESVSATTAGAAINVTGTGKAPADATAVLVALTVTATHPVTVATWTTGRPPPKVGDAFPAGTSLVMQVQRPDATGNISVRTLKGKAAVTARVLGWATGVTSLAARGTPASLGTIKPGKVRTIPTAGLAGVPADVQATWVAIAAPKNAAVSVWRTPTAKGTALHTWTSTGSPVSLRLPVGSARRVAIEVTKTRGTTRVTVNGWESSYGSRLTMMPRQGTIFLGEADTLTYDGGTLILAATADEPVVGGHVVATVDGVPYTLAVIGVDVLPDGQHSLQVQPATAQEAFADIDAVFGKQLAPDPKPTTRPPDRGLARVSSPRGHVVRRGVEPTAGGGFNVPFAVGTPSCSVNGPLPTFSLNFDGHAHIEYHLVDGIIDVSLKGGITSSLGLSSDTAVRCAWEAPPLAQVSLIGPFVLKLKPTVSVSLEPPSGESANLELSTSAHAYAAVYYAKGGDPVAGHAFNLDGDDQSGLGGGTGKVDLGIKAAFGLPEFGEFEIGPEAAITFGISLKLGPPDPDDDTFYHRHLQGPNCTDASAGLYIEFGIAFLLPFWDVHLDIARFDPVETVWSRGPCVGYVGTITTTWDGSYPKGGAGCTAQSCPSKTWHHTLVRTMVPDLADFDPGYNIVVQPYTWTWTATEVVDDDVPTTFDGSRTTPCTWTTTFNGSGSASWDDFEGASDSWYTKSWQGWAPDSPTYYNTDFYGGSSQSTVQVAGDPDWCGTGSTGPSSPPGFDSNGQAGELDINKEALASVQTFWPSSHPERAWHTTFALTRQEYARDLP